MRFYEGVLVAMVFDAALVAAVCVAWWLGSGGVL